MDPDRIASPDLATAEALGREFFAAIDSRDPAACARPWRTTRRSGRCRTGT
jgi:hypothetical protein